MIREQWLMNAVKELEPWFVKAGHPLPKKLRVSIGFPSRRVKRVLGICFSAANSKDEHREIFINPSKHAEPVDILETLLHELCHAALPPEVQHKRKFIVLATAVGLHKPWKSAGATPETKERLNAIVKKLGKVSYGKLTLMSAERKQTTRLVKCECSECGYVVRTTRRWLESVGSPLCPVAKHGSMDFELPE